MGDVLLHLTISKQKKKVAVPEINEAQQLTHLYFKEWENPAEYFMVAWPPDCPHVKIGHRKPHWMKIWQAPRKFATLAGCIQGWSPRLTIAQGNSSWQITQTNLLAQVG